MRRSRSRRIQLALFCCTLTYTVSLQTFAAQSTAVPPFYQRLPAQISPAQSMVYGPGTTNGGLLPRRDWEYRHPTIAPQCEHLPQSNDLRSRSGMEPATVKQAQNLGIVLRSRTGAAEPFRTGQVVLWRFGKYALCKDVQQHTLVYGAEWAVAFLLQDTLEPPPTTWAELNLSIQRGHLVELGSVVNGGIRTEALGEQLQGLANGWAQTEEIFLQRLVAVRAAWPAEALQVDLTVPLGVATP